MNINVDVPNGKSGNWEVETFEVPENSIGSLRLAWQGRPIKPGMYKSLKRGMTLVMSNTPAEIRDFVHIIRRAKGNILINGLGLGVLLTAILEKTEVKTVTVIEKSQDVINLVAPTFSSDERVTIICADAFEYQPPKGVRYDCVWHDIWDNICTDNIDEMSKLHRKYGKRCEYQDSWCRDLLKRTRAQEKCYGY